MHGITYRTINNLRSKVSLLISSFHIFLPGKKINFLSHEKHPVTLIEAADLKSSYHFETVFRSILTI